jgi:hypothetical protein
MEIRYFDIWNGSYYMRIYAHTVCAVSDNDITDPSHTFNKSIYKCRVILAGSPFTFYFKETKEEFQEKMQAAKLLQFFDT